ncbi:MAG TPA: aldolase/citrate lyase family protein [Ruminiclostridium sp.]|nr:aldolase/citrate lyase family protein [Ruminiclostridium sp.]
MNLMEREMLDLLIDLKENHHAFAAKVSFASEASRLEDLIRINEIILRADMGLFVKIGGCEAVKDMEECKLLGASGIMVPMIETPFAMSKFIGTVNRVFSKSEQRELEFAAYVDSLTGFGYIDGILSVDGIEAVDAVVVGRRNLTASMGFNGSDINGDEVCRITKTILEKVRDKGMTGGISGGISMEAVPFVRRLGGLIKRHETRKLIFKTPDTLKSINTGLLKALHFEMLYLLNKRDYYGRAALEDEERIKLLESRIKSMEEIIGGGR